MSGRKRSYFTKLTIMDMAEKDVELRISYILIQFLVPSIVVSKTLSYFIFFRNIYMNAI